MIDPSTWTGERLETFVYNDTTFEHLHRYAISLQLSAGKKVLDIACGEGYGSNLIAQYATEVIGVDISQETIDIATKKYQRDNLKFLQGSADAIPCESNYFDVVVSFETIEHHDRHDEMMQEIKRVLTKEGILIISSPDKKFYSDKPGGYQNPYHVKELYKDEFQHLLDKYFSATQMLSQTSFIGSMILTDTTNTAAATVFEGDYNQVSLADLEAPYCVAIAGNTTLPLPNSSFFKSTLVLEERMQRAEQEMYAAMSQKITDFVTFQVTARVTKEVTDYVTHKVTTTVTEQVTKQVTDFVTHQVTEQVAAAVTKRVTEQVTHNVTEQVTEKVTREVTEQVAQKTKADTITRMEATKPYKIGATVLKPFQYLNQIFQRR